MISSLAVTHPVNSSLSRREMLRAAATVLPVLTGFTRDVISAAPKLYWPRANEWETRSPKDSGMDPAGLEDAANYAAEHNSSGLVVLRGGRIVSEKYWQDWTPETSQPIFSSSKSIAATLVGMAIDERKLKGVTQRVADFIPSWEGTPKTAITLRHIMTMTSGIEVGAGRVSPDVDAFEETAAFPLEKKPGEYWAYNTPVYRMLIRILELASGEGINQYTTRKLAQPIGMRSSSWDCAPAPRGKTNCTWYRSSLRDMARFGLLILRNGMWDDRQLISAAYIKESTSTSQKLNPAYGYLWWLNGKASFKLAGGREGQGMLWPDCPADAFGALGAQDKKIYVVPSLDLIVARHGGAASVARAQGEGGGRSSFDNELLGRICRSAR